MTGLAFWHSVRRIVPLAWPVFVGQIAVLVFSTVDTVMAARSSSLDLAALAIGASVYVSVFVGLMGVVLAVGPITGHWFGARRLDECGAELHQAIWLALAVAVVGCGLLWFPQPFLDLARASPEVSEKVRGYLHALAFALPPALLFTAYRGFNIALGRPKAVMAIQLGALALKVPLNALLVFGTTLPTPFGEWDLAPMGAPGCGLATAIVMFGQLATAWVVLQRDPFYRPFGVTGRLAPPSRARLLELLRLGVPMGLSIMIEVTGFTFMAFFIARIGTTAVAGHQIAVNVVSLMFMVPMAIANATSTLVAQRIGAGDALDARRLGWHGLQVGVLVAAVVATCVYTWREQLIGLYTPDAIIVAAALPLLAWVGVFHVADAAQTVAAFVLRAHRIATVPLVVYTLAIWGVGLGGGFALAFDESGLAPAWLHGAVGFWAAATAGLWLAATAMIGYLATMRAARNAPAPPALGPGSSAVSNTTAA